jgi:hypothetical protein
MDGMKRIFAIIGAILSGAIGLAVFASNSVEAGFSLN